MTCVTNHEWFVMNVLWVSVMNVSWGMSQWNKSRRINTSSMCHDLRRVSQCVAVCCSVLHLCCTTVIWDPNDWVYCVAECCSVSQTYQCVVHVSWLVSHTWMSMVNAPHTCMSGCVMSHVSLDRVVAYECVMTCVTHMNECVWWMRHTHEWVCWMCHTHAWVW